MIIFKEIFQKETIAQVTSFLLDLIEISSDIPDIIIYDDACHLAKYVTNKSSNLFKNNSKRADVLSKKRFFCDRFHFIKHKDDWCQKNCNPDDIPELENINTVVCEETNKWFGGFKYALKHMNYGRFHLMLYILSDEYNKFKLVNNRYEKEKSLNKC